VAGKEMRKYCNMMNTEDVEFKLRNFIECSHLGTWEWNIQTGETVFNETWAEIIGYSLDELQPGKHLRTPMTSKFLSSSWSGILMVRFPFMKLTAG
jgi:PAS domain-containing protein